MAKYFSEYEDQRKHAEERIEYAFSNNLPLTIIVHSKEANKTAVRKITCMYYFRFSQ